MTEPVLRSFDAGALYSALDGKRAELGLSWRRVADQLWNLSSQLNDRRRGHPISPSTLTKMATSPRTSCQHALFLRRLDRNPESFLRGMAEGNSPRFALPRAGPDRRRRWNLRELYDAMDDERRHRGMTWAELSAALRCTPSQLTGLRTAKFAMDRGLAMRLTQWLGRAAASFVHPATW